MLVGQHIPVTQDVLRQEDRRRYVTFTGEAKQLATHGDPAFGPAALHGFGECRLLGTALDSCERYFTAFQFVVWAGKTAREALDAAMFETSGEA